MANQDFLQLLSTLLTQVESLTNEKEPELRSKIEALGLEVSKVPSTSTKPMDELELASELDKISTKLADADKKISAADPEVKTLLSGTADVWMPVITATTDERRNFVSTNDSPNVQREDSERAILSWKQLSS